MMTQCDFCVDKTEEVYTPDDGITILCNDCHENNEELLEEQMMTMSIGRLNNARDNHYSPKRKEETA